MFLPAIVRQGDLFTVAGRQSEIGCHIPLLQHLPYTSSGFSVADKGDVFCPSPEEPPIAPAMPKAAPYRRMLPSGRLLLYHGLSRKTPGRLSGAPSHHGKGTGPHPNRFGPRPDPDHQGLSALAGRLRPTVRPLFRHRKRGLCSTGYVSRRFRSRRPALFLDRSGNILFLGAFFTLPPHIPSGEALVFSFSV